MRTYNQCVVVLLFALVLPGIHAADGETFVFVREVTKGFFRNAAFLRAICRLGEETGVPAACLAAVHEGGYSAAIVADTTAGDALLAENLGGEKPAFWLRLGKDAEDLEGVRRALSKDGIRRTIAVSKAGPVRTDYTECGDSPSTGRVGER